MVAVRATTQFGATKVSTTKFTVDTTPPALWDFRMVCEKDKILCGQEATSRPDRHSAYNDPQTAGTGTGTTDIETTLMVHNSRDFSNLRIEFAAFDQESAVHNYKWELYRNEYSFKRATSDGSIVTCTEVHIEDCDQGTPKDSHLVKATAEDPLAGGSEDVESAGLYRPLGSTAINTVHASLSSADVPVYACGTAANASAAIACVCTKSYQIQRTKSGQICTALVTTFGNIGNKINDWTKLQTEELAQHNRNYTFSLTVVNGAGLRTVQRRTIQVDVSPPISGDVGDNAAGGRDVDWQVTPILKASWSGFHDPESGIRGYLYKWTPFVADCAATNPTASACPTIGVGCTWNAVEKRCASQVKCHAPPSDKTDASDLGSWSFTNELSVSKTLTDAEVDAKQKWVITVIAYNNALDMSRSVCSDGVVVDNTKPPNGAVTQVRIAGLRGPSRAARPARPYEALRGPRASRASAKPARPARPLGPRRGPRLTSD